MDCLVRLELPDAVAVADAVLGPGRNPGAGLTRQQLIERADGLASAAKRRRIQEVLALADEASESVGESRSRAFIHVLGLPAPVLQHVFHDREGFIARTDFFWPEAKVIGEFDGDAKYSYTDAGRCPDRDSARADRHSPGNPSACRQRHS